MPSATPILSRVVGVKNDNHQRAGKMSPGRPGSAVDHDPKQHIPTTLGLALGGIRRGCRVRVLNHGDLNGFITPVASLFYRIESRMWLSIKTAQPSLALLGPLET